jgi:hypothetical protein
MTSRKQMNGEPFLPPPLSPAQVQQVFAKAAFEASVSLFRAYDVSVEAADIEAFRQKPELTLVSVIGFAGRQLSGSLVLGATHDPLARSNPTTASDRDWIAELANQLLGRIKNKILRLGIEVYAVPPSVVSGQHLAPVLANTDFRPWIFSTPGGLACVWIDLSVTSELHVDQELTNSTEIPTEGDVLLF